MSGMKNGNNNLKRLINSLFLLCACTCMQAQSVSPFQKGDRVTFVGNSITDGGHYHSYIWLYYMTHFPKMRLWMANCGVGGDTAKEMLARFDDDVLTKEPTVLTFTFGMNDTGYYEYNGDDSAAFARRKLEEAKTQFALCEEKLKSLKGIRTVMIGTSPYDQTSTFNNDIFARKNDNMQRVIALQKEAAKRNGWEFLDLNAPMVALNMKQQESDPAFTIIGNDRIHPDNDGHMVMAYLFLQAQGMIGKKVADMQLDATSGKATRSENCRISRVKRTSDGLQFDCLAASLPFPLDTIAHGWGFNNGAAKVTKVIPTFIDDLSDEHLTVGGLNADQYELSIDGIIIDTLSAATLAKGINLAKYRHTPQYQQALAVMSLNETRWDVERRFREWAWVNYDFMMPAGFLNDNSERAAQKFRELCKDNAWLASKRGTYDQMVRPEVRKAYQEEMDLLVSQIYKLNQPKKHTFKLRDIASATPSTTGNNGNVRLLYWNIQNGMWDGQQDDYLRFTSWVTAQQPDICVWCEAQKLYKTGTAESEKETEQECLDRWKRLAARYGHHYIYLSAHPDNYPQLITSRFPMENEKLIKGNADTIVCHGASWYKVRIGKKLVNLVTLHTWPQGYGFKVPADKREESRANSEGDKFRRAEMEYICRQTILSHAKPELRALGARLGSKESEKELWAMMGDFNSVSRVDNSKYKLPDDSPKFLVHDYIRSQTPYEDIIKASYPDSIVSSTGGGSRIDFMYLTPALHKCVKKAGIANDDYTKPVRNPQKISNFWHPSDHLPIIVDFAL